MKFRILVDGIEGHLVDGLEGCEPFYVTSDQKTFTFFRGYCTITGVGLFDISRIQQWTGLTDRNGKDIYIGDIVQYNNNSSYDGIDFTVKRKDENQLGFNIVSKNRDYLYNARTPDGFRYDKLEIMLR